MGLFVFGNCLGLQHACAYKQAQEHGVIFFCGGLNMHEVLYDADDQELFGTLQYLMT